MIRSLLLLCLSILISCQSGEKPSAQADLDKEESSQSKTQKKTIIFFGDSITAGYQLDLSEAFPALIQERLDSLGLPYRSINAGLSGETTASGSSRVAWVLKNPVDIFVLELGANDGLRGIKTSETIKNLEAIILKVRSTYPECKIILAGMMIPPNMGQGYTQDFQEIFPTLAKKYELPLIPFLLDQVAGIPALNLEDGIHPTPEGHQVVMDNVWDILEPLL